MKKLEKIFANHGCLLRCIAEPLVNGGFRPKAEITRFCDKKLLTTETFDRIPSFITGAEAIEHGRAWAVQWVRTVDPNLP